MHWLEELVQNGRVERSRVASLEIGRLEFWANSGYLNLTDKVIEVRSGCAEDFRVVAERRLAQIRPPAPAPVSEVAGGEDGLCTFFLVAEGAHRLRSCRTSQLAVEMASFGLTAPKIGLVENLDVLLGWRADDLQRLGLQGCEVILLTRGWELVREITWLALMDANASEVRCAFDFDEEGLLFFLSANEVLGDRCRVAWPEDLDEVFRRTSMRVGAAQVLHPEQVHAELEGWADCPDTNKDGLRWARLLFKHGVGVEQRALLV